MLKNFCKLSVIIMFFFMVENIFAVDFVSIGRTYPIAETDLLVYIKDKLQRWQQQGKIKHYQQELQKRVRQYVVQPRKVTDVSTTKHSRSYYFDPTIVLDKSKGKKINPLDYIQLSHTLLFFDASDNDQVCWAEKQRRVTGNRNKYILTGGNIKITMSKLHKKIYFDQFGYLVKRLRIKHVPATVRQVDNKLRIEEQLPCQS